MKETMKRVVEGDICLDRQESERLIGLLMNPDEEACRKAKNFMDGVEFVGYGDDNITERYEISDLITNGSLSDDVNVELFSTKVVYRKKMQRYVSSTVFVNGIKYHEKNLLENNQTRQSNKKSLFFDERMLIA